jgi:hypothetical protein
MAQKVTVQLVDDLDGGAAEETVTFSLDGTAYEIDLSSANAAKMRDTFAQYVGAGRRVGSRSGAGRNGSRGTGRRRDNKVAEIREWARKNGHKVNDRGRISADIMQAYEKANS